MGHDLKAPFKSDDLDVRQVWYSSTDGTKGADVD